ncbi:hypothetical protein LZ30DRAFT_708638, partial [Colletotrichum cereale]
MKLALVHSPEKTPHSPLGQGLHTASPPAGKQHLTRDQHLRSYDPHSPLLPRMQMQMRAHHFSSPTAKRRKQSKCAPNSKRGSRKAAGKQSPPATPPSPHSGPSHLRSLRPLASLMGQPPLLLRCSDVCYHFEPEVELNASDGYVVYCRYHVAYRSQDTWSPGPHNHHRKLRGHHSLCRKAPAQMSCSQRWTPCQCHSHHVQKHPHYNPEFGQHSLRRSLMQISR